MPRKCAVSNYSISTQRRFKTCRGLRNCMPLRLGSWMLYAPKGDEQTRQLLHQPRGITQVRLQQTEESGEETASAVVTPTTTARA